MLAGEFENIAMTPGIGREFVEVRSLPVRRICWSLQELREAVLSFWKRAVVHREGLKRCSERRDLNLGGGNTGTFSPLRDLGIHESGEDGEYRQDEQQFNEREPAVVELNLSW